jgi:hypothetical protein
VPELNVALVGVLGVMLGGYFNNFLAEDYRRFRDGQALAGALAGELESHAEPIPMIKDSLEKMHSELLAGRGLSTPEWPIPSSPIFEQNAAKIGLLGPQTARDVAYVYEHLRAFRQNFNQLTKYHATMSNEWCQGVVGGCLAIITRAQPRASVLITRLREQAEENYWSRAQTRIQLKWGAGAIIAFLIALKLFF